MATIPARSPLEHEHVALLAGSMAHVLDYLSTGSTRAALRAQLLLDRLDISSAPCGAPAAQHLRQALGGQGWEAR
jgi:hypothetical protein